MKNPFHQTAISPEVQKRKEAYLKVIAALEDLPTADAIYVLTIAKMEILGI